MTTLQSSLCSNCLTARSNKLQSCDRDIKARFQNNVFMVSDSMYLVCILIPNTRYHFCHPAHDDEQQQLPQRQQLCSNTQSGSSGSSTPSLLPLVHPIHLPISPPGHRFVRGADSTTTAMHDDEYTPPIPVDCHPRCTQTIKTLCGSTAIHWLLKIVWSSPVIYDRRRPCPRAGSACHPSCKTRQ